MNPEMIEGQEIVVQTPQPLLTDLSEDILVRAERRINQLERIKSLALKVTNSSDWSAQGDQPYLECSGAEKVARLFGVCWYFTTNEPKKVLSEDEKGKFYFYVVRGVFSLGNDKIESIGTCSSRDPFFASRRGPDGKLELKPASEVDETDVAKKCVTNCVGTGIKRILGLRGLTWEEVETGGKVTRGNVAKVSFASGGAGGGLISEPQAKRLFALLRKGNRTPEELKAYLEEKYKLDSTTKIERKDYESICGWAEGIAAAQ